MVEIDPADQEWKENYRIMTTSVLPRPIGWISTRSADGTDNIAPFSHFNTVCPSPPVIMFSAGDREGGELKHTAQNAIETEEFAFNLVTESLAEQMDNSSASLDEGESEFEFAGIERAACERISVPRVAESPVCMECTLYDARRVYGNMMVEGEVTYFHIDDALLVDGKIDMHKVDAIGRLGGPFYTNIEIMDLTREFYSESASGDGTTES